MEFIKINSNTDYARFDIINFPDKVIDFINEVLNKTDGFGEIFIMSYGKINYYRGTLQENIPKEWSNLTIEKIKAESSWGRTDYFVYPKEFQKLN